MVGTRLEFFVKRPKANSVLCVGCLKKLDYIEFLLSWLVSIDHKLVFKDEYIHWVQSYSFIVIPKKNELRWKESISIGC